MDVEEFLRGLDEPPEVLRSMDAFLADRRGFDPASWDADQERAARATVVETHAGHVVPSTRPHVDRGLRPGDVRVRTRAANSPPSARPSRRSSRPTTQRGRERPPSHAPQRPAWRPVVRRSATVLFGKTGHNLMRYRPDELGAAILAAAAPVVASNG